LKKSFVYGFVEDSRDNLTMHPKLFQHKKGIQQI